MFVTLVPMFVKTSWEIYVQCGCVVKLQVHYKFKSVITEYIEYIFVTLFHLSQG